MVRFDYTCNNVLASHGVYVGTSPPPPPLVVIHTMLCNNYSYVLPSKLCPNLRESMINDLARIIYD